MENKLIDLNLLSRYNANIKDYIFSKDLPILDLSETYRTGLFNNTVTFTDDEVSKINKLINDYKKKYYPNDDNLNGKSLAFYCKSSTNGSNVTLFTQNGGLKSSSGTIYLSGIGFDAAGSPYIRLTEWKIEGTWTNGVFSLSNKTYVFRSTYAYINSLMNTNGNQTVSGIKTFTSLPKSSALPTDNAHLVNKAYADSLIETPRELILEYSGDTADFLKSSSNKILGAGGSEEVSKINQFLNDAYKSGYHNVLIRYVAKNNSHGGIPTSLEFACGVDLQSLSTDGSGSSTGFYSTYDDLFDGEYVTRSIYVPTSYDTELKVFNFNFADAGYSINSSEISASNPFARRNSINSKLAEKQDKLTAGTNIEITANNVINCTIDVASAVSEAIAGITQFSLIPVDTLPTENIRTDAIYAIPSDNPKEQDVRIEYVYINDSWEVLGNTKIDLSDYYTKSEIDAMITTNNDIDLLFPSNEVA